MILQVHDELVFDVPIAEKAIFEEMIVEKMQNILISQTLKDIPQDMRVPPIVVDISSGNNWAEAK